VSLLDEEQGFKCFQLRHDALRGVSRLHRDICSQTTSARSSSVNKARQPYTDGEVRAFHRRRGSRKVGASRRTSLPVNASEQNSFTEFYLHLLIWAYSIRLKDRDN
jgi:hypothetical protein